MCVATETYNYLLYATYIIISCYICWEICRVVRLLLF